MIEQPDPQKKSTPEIFLWRFAAIGALSMLVAFPAVANIFPNMQPEAKKALQHYVLLGHLLSTLAAVLILNRITAAFLQKYQLPRQDRLLLLTALSGSAMAGALWWLLFSATGLLDPQTAQQVQFRFDLLANALACGVAVHAIERIELRREEIQSATNKTVSLLMFCWTKLRRSLKNP